VTFQNQSHFVFLTINNRLSLQGRNCPVSRYFPSHDLFIRVPLTFLFTYIWRHFHLSKTTAFVLTYIQSKQKFKYVPRNANCNIFGNSCVASLLLGYPSTVKSVASYNWLPVHQPEIYLKLYKVKKQMIFKRK
jgi:hypothetical protein